MKTVRFHKKAETEMIEAAVYYESRQPDLGKRFLVCIQEAIHKIQINPLLYPIVHLDVRRCLTRTFPFG
jgi:toxin ParE1/3/4